MQDSGSSSPAFQTTIYSDNVTSAWSCLRAPKASVPNVRYRDLNRGNRMTDFGAHSRHALLARRMEAARLLSDQPSTVVAAGDFSL
jgi:hypothetical protein